MSKQIEMAEILKAIKLPPKLSNRRAVLTMLALAGLREKDSWIRVSEEYKGPNAIILFVNENYPNKGGTDDRPYAINTRESFRDETITPLCELSILEKNGMQSQSGNHAYRLTKETANLFRSYGTTEWDDELQFFLETHKTYSELYAQVRRVDKGLPITFAGNSFTLTRSAHNKLQADILNEFAPRFAPDSKLLYIGDTKNRKLVEDEKMFAWLGLPPIDNSLMPDVVLYNERHSWLLFVEAYISSGPMSVERVTKLKRYCKNIRRGIEPIFITAFHDMKICKSKLLEIAWEKEIWVAEEPDHMIHLNGTRFLPAHS